DLQAVADGGPLRYAREPIPSRAGRWVRRNRVRLALSTPVIAGVLALGFAFLQTKFAEVRQKAEVQHSIDQGMHEELLGHYDLAASHYATAERLADPLPNNRPEPAQVSLPSGSLAELKRDAHRHYRQVGEAMRVRANAERLFRISGKLRFDLLGFGGSGRPDSQALEAALAPFYVMKHENWTQQPELSYLDPIQKTRLIGEVEELLFFWAVASSTQAQAHKPEPLRQAIRICDRALVFSRSKPAWMALRDLCEQRQGNEVPVELSAPSPRSLNSDWEAFQWGLIRLANSREDPDRAVGWLERSVQLDPSRYWTQYFLAYCYEKTGRSERALGCCNTAIALDKSSPWAHFSRAQLLWHRGAWQQALDDLNQSIALAQEQGYPFVEARLGRGFVRLRLGDVVDARADFEAVLRLTGAASAFGRSARLDLAMLDYEAGRVEKARRAYDALLSESSEETWDPTGEGVTALLGRAQLSLWTGQPSEAETDLSRLLSSDPKSAESFALRARARLAMGRSTQAVEDARAAFELEPLPSRERLLLRARLAAGQVNDLVLDRPSALLELPGPRSALRADLRAAERLLASQGDHPSARLNR
ncbi:MAG TPA: tetratricopeptide repeat protein, partial [Isosphaeraceae bacterium]|nr:tetratricopeptide repeat protein [Isosphaeraceae bacterium]